MVASPRKHWIDVGACLIEVDELLSAGSPVESPVHVFARNVPSPFKARLSTSNRYGKSCFNHSISENHGKGGSIVSDSSNTIAPIEEEGMLMSLPTELILAIMRHVDGETLARLSCVCKRIRAIIHLDAHHLWRAQCVKRSWSPEFFISRNNGDAWRAFYAERALIHKKWMHGAFEEVKETAQAEGVMSFVPMGTGDWGAVLENCFNGDNNNNIESENVKVESSLQNEKKVEEDAVAVAVATVVTPIKNTINGQNDARSSLLLDPTCFFLSRPLPVAF
eukprot:UC1_evm1s574